MQQKEICEGGIVLDGDASLSPKLTKERKGAYTATALISDITFFVLLIVVAVVILSTGGADGRPRIFFGYSMMNVLTGSMQSELPVQSFVLTKVADPGTIVVGENITFIRSDNNVVTHQVIEVLDNYEDSGERVFRTKGLANPQPDMDVVYSANVIGRVVYSNAELGIALSFVRERMWLAAGMAGLVVVLLMLLKYITKPVSGPADEHESEEKDEKLTQKEVVCQ
jgi:signal peptidase